jgi:hypothetical protein
MTIYDVLRVQPLGSELKNLILSGLPVQGYYWSETVNGNVQKEIARDLTKSLLGTPKVLNSYVDANLQHNMLTGRPVNGVLHFGNQTLVYLFSKCKACLQTATFGSELE